MQLVGQLLFVFFALTMLVNAANNQKEKFNCIIR